MTLPNFYICGAPKAGTTALYNYLRQHDDIYFPEKKETIFFSDRKQYTKGIEWFTSTYYASWNGETAVGEASPQMLASPEAPYRIAEHCPDARLIVLLRDPVERIYSHYYYDVRAGRLNPLGSFSACIRRPTLWRRRMLWTGKYYDHLRRYADCFDRAQIMPILNRDLRENTGAVVQDVLRFIGVDPDVSLEVTERRNVTKYPAPEPVFNVVWGALHKARMALGSRFFVATKPLAEPLRKAFYQGDTSKPPMDEADRAYLADRYAPWNRRLADYLGRDLSHWS